MRREDVPEIAGLIPCGGSLFSLILFCFLRVGGRYDTHKGKPLWLSINNILTKHCDRFNIWARRFVETKPQTMNTQLLFLWQRYFFNRDIGDVNRANYWLKRIEELTNNKNPKQ